VPETTTKTEPDTAAAALVAAGTWSK
jgi:hypothetical protein